MNVHAPPHPQPEATQAADGLPRRAWTFAEIEAMQRAGIISEDERFELIGGEVVPMSPKGAFHEVVKMELARFWFRAAPDNLNIIPETTLRLDDRNFVEPDFCVFRRPMPLNELSGSTAMLAVEVSDSSLAYDLGRKIGIYAAFGLREVWVINALSLVTRIHRKLGPSGYADVEEHRSTVCLTPMLAPEMAVRLADLALKPSRKRGKSEP